MAKLWAKVNGTWVSLGAQSKDDVGLGNVQNFTFTNSTTESSSSTYVTGAAVKGVRDIAESAASAPPRSRLGPEQFTTSKAWNSDLDGLGALAEVPVGHVITRAINTSGSFYRIGHREVL